MIKKYIDNFISKNRSTLLGVGPMSINCVDATIELSNEYNIPIMLIASRRQIDSNYFNGGYVNNWTTQKYSEYVFSRDNKNNIILARDHGGPWQNNKEIQEKLNLREAMNSAKESYKVDIDCGFKVIHIDPSIDIHETPSQNQLLERLFELYDFCCEYAIVNKKDIIFEIGTEEQSGSTNTQEELDFTLSQVKRFCKKNNFPNPTFVVVQTGTKVMETKNIGSFDSPLRVYNEIPAEIQIPKMIEICEKHKIYMKEHNTDYLSDVALSWHPRLGIHSANVAPEFGVIESKAFVNLLEENNLKFLGTKFLDLSYKSKKWEKWMLPNTTASDYEKSIISGHYIFSTPEFIEIKNEASHNLKKKLDIDDFLRQEVKKGILRYLYNFRLIKNK